ncbi:hypothetical protein D805_0725 [Bifidobacterium thermophilum RBL67]|uniref:Uncharacterized protein n=1 Tax=Bifidobacterium thermophilum RBL67 TaxID=1254439 RepID=M4RR72_9BIFI|nr:hypothetical protein D805_0725 [Bifidobacterium thermophilum RBL67]
MGEGPQRAAVASRSVTWQVMGIRLALPGGWYSNICSYDAV